MFENIILGPICIYRTQEDLQGMCRALFYDNWIPLGTTNKGETFEAVKQQQTGIEPGSPITGIILSVGFKKLYAA